MLVKKGATSRNGANVGGATPSVESRVGGALTTDGGSGTAADDVVDADRDNSGSSSSGANEVNGGYSVNGGNGAANGGATTCDGISKDGMLEGGFQYPKRILNVLRINLPIMKAHLFLPSLYHYLNYLYQMLKIVYLSPLSRIG